MSADHRKPVVAFVVLAFLAAALVGVQRADAQGGGFMAAVLAHEVHAHGRVPAVATLGDPGRSTLPGVLALNSAAPATSAPLVAARTRGRQAEVSRGHGRSDAPADAGRRPTRTGVSGEPGPADRAADQARAAVAKPMPQRAVARGRTSGEHGHRSARSRSTR